MADIRELNRVMRASGQARQQVERQLAARRGVNWRPLLPQILRCGG